MLLSWMSRIGPSRSTVVPGASVAPEGGSEIQVSDRASSSTARHAALSCTSTNERVPERGRRELERVLG
jgi:hypothetical protein